MVPRILVSTALNSRPRSFAIPKSAILGHNSASSSIFSGLMSQCMMESLHSSCR
ncbi:hypothetical protein DAI22_01g086708 [Oryza sativa Japonica Group]|nr:hypothetical protein DAI22_01g086708 [Oryza sativa Japonica Group]